MFEIAADGTRRDLTLQLGLQGTCTLVLYRGHYFVLFTRHQIAPVSNETLQEFRTRMELLFVLMDDGRDSWNLPIRDFLFASDGDGQDDESDFVVGEVEPQMLTDFMRAQFFPADRTFIGRTNDQALCAGLPGHRQLVLMEKGGLRIEAVCKPGIVTHRSYSASSTVEYKSDGEPLDGMSGGVVFLVRLDPEPRTGMDFVIFIDGIIQRGGNGYVRYLRLERILDRIDAKLSAFPNVSVQEGA